MINKYDPKKIIVTIDGQEIHGFTDSKFTCGKEKQYPAYIIYNNGRKEGINYMEVTGKNLLYIVNESKKNYSEPFNKWLIDNMENRNEFNTILTVENIQGKDAVIYRLIDNVDNNIISETKMETKTVERDK